LNCEIIKFSAGKWRQILWYLKSKWPLISIGILAIRWPGTGRGISSFAQHALPAMVAAIRDIFTLQS